MDFLTLAEAQAVDRAKLSGAEKFLARLTIYSWHLLQSISEQTDRTIDSLEVNHILDWIETDRDNPEPTLRWQGPDFDFPDDGNDPISMSPLSSHEKFLCRMLITAQPVLASISADCQTPIGNLTLTQILDWIESDCERKRTEGKQPAFLDRDNTQTKV